MPAGITYSTVATTTLGSATPSYTFTSVPTTYTDIILIADMSPGATNFDIRVGNGSADSGTNYSSTRLFGDGTSATSDRQVNNSTGLMGNVDNSTTNQSNLIMHLQNYSNTSTFKSAIIRWNRVESYVLSIVGLWRSTSAINTIQIRSTSGQNIPAGTVLTLYGISAA